MNREEAIKILREVHDDSLFSVRTALETLIPELKESEDENMIRKALLEYLQRCVKCNPLTEEVEKIMKDGISWLKKQGEQKHAWSEEDTRMLNFLIENVECCSEGKSMLMIHSTALKYLDWLKELKDRVIPQSKQEWSEEDKKMVVNIGKYLNSYGNSLKDEDKANAVFKSVDWLKSL